MGWPYCELATTLNWPPCMFRNSPDLFSADRIAGICACHMLAGMVIDLACHVPAPAPGGGGGIGAGAGTGASGWLLRGRPAGLGEGEGGDTPERTPGGRGRPT
eukprot:659494-Pyramimonas_sp.AAC.1